MYAEVKSDSLTRVCSRNAGMARGGALLYVGVLESVLDRNLWRSCGGGLCDGACDGCCGSS